MKKFPFYKQPDAMDCGPTCLRMIAKHYGRTISLQKLRAISETTREGSTLKNIAEAAENIGFRSLGVKIDFEKLKEDAPLPCIVFWQQQHFVVVYKITKKVVYVADPGHGLILTSNSKISSNFHPENSSSTRKKINLKNQFIPNNPKFNSPKPTSHFFKSPKKQLLKLKTHPNLHLKFVFL